MISKQFLDLKFTLLNTNKKRVFLVVFILVYSILFLNLFIPFNINNWENKYEVSQLIYLSNYGVIGSLGIAFSQLYLRKWFKTKQFLIRHFFIWTLFELFFLTFLLTITYGDIDEFSNLYSELVFTLKHTFLIVVIPYSVALLILSLIQKKTELIALKKQQKKVVLSSEIINFYNEKGNVKLSIFLSDLIYIESMENYVFIYYLANNELKKELLRNSLKKLEEKFKNFPIKRCHRSYMVNLENMILVKIKGQKIEVKLKNLPYVIPVSRSYHQEFKNYL